MDQTNTYPDPMQLDRRAELEQVLAAWHGATLRLEQTHEALRGEVCRLTDELEVKNRELARKNRLADLGQMASHIAHEVRNNLVPVTLYLSLLRGKRAADQREAEILDKIEAGFVALDATVNDLLSFTSDRDPRLESFELRPMVDDVCGSLAPQLTAQGIEQDTTVPAGLVLRADRGMVRRAILNLTLNALDAMPDGGRLSIAAESVVDAIELSIRDDGPGMTDEALRRACEPFFTTKSGGTGLGLAIVSRIAEVHGGELETANDQNGGAVFTLRFPQSLA